MEYKVLANGVKMPMVGFGVYKLGESKEETAERVLTAIEEGYRLIDTAESYENEDAVGLAVRRAIDKGICTREELFISTKIHTPFMSNYDIACGAIEKSLEKSGLEYFDLFLLHYALNDYFSGYRALEEAYKNGKTRAIGVSNFYAPFMVNLCESVRICPMVNQIETHPFYVRKPDLEVNDEYGAVTEAWSPLGGEIYDFKENETFREIAKKYSKSVAQIALKWNLERGVVVIPKSSTRERMRENIELFDFNLDKEDMQKLESLDMGYSGVRIELFEKEFVRARLGVDILDFRVVYHETEESEASRMQTRVIRGQLRETLTTDELNFNNNGKEFLGWKVYRECDDTFRVKNKKGKAEWLSLKNGKLPRGYEFLLYKNGEPVMGTAPRGNVHFYGVWE